MFYMIAAALLVAADQLVKFLVRANIPLYESIPFLPHLMNLTYVQNTGAAFSSFSEHTWVLTLISAVFSVLLAVAVLQKKYAIHPIGRWALTAVLAGAVGNLIDRAAFGFVTDMFQTTFINFAVFNVADICVVLGGIAFVAYYVFLDEKLMKKERIMTTQTLTASLDGQRLDQFAAEQVDGLTRSAAQKLIEEGRLTRNGQPLKKNVRTEAGAEYRLVLPDPEPVDIIPQDIPLDIVYEDADVIVVNKPVGLVVHPAPGHPDGTLVNALLYHCGTSLSGINGALRPGIVHRIDRDTSGLLIVAKNDFAHQKLADQLQDHTLAREYEAIAVGGFREDSGTVDAPIGRHRTDRKKMAVDPNGRPAVTHWEVASSYRGHTHIICHLETGRTHQIRVHMASIGHPLLGDPVYGKPYPGLTGQCLHARKLRFRHPRTGEPVEVECPRPDWFQAVLDKLERMS